MDYIIDSLHDDPTTLLQASLVSRAWVGRTRTHLCKSLKITCPKLLSLDPAHLTPLCGHVKTLHFTWPYATDPYVVTVLDCFEQSEPHTLVVYSFSQPSLSEQTMRRCFAKFPRTSITTLELHDISLTHGTFLILLSSFPNIDDLTISVDDWKGGPGADNRDTIQCTPTPCLRGSFKFVNPPCDILWGSQRGKILHAVVALPLQFQTISLDFKEQTRGDLAVILNSCSKTVRKLFVGAFIRKSQPYISSVVPCAQCANE